MTYLFLAIAVIAEVVATLALKASVEFTKLQPSLIVVIGYSVSFYFFTLVLRVIPIGTMYAIWSGLGIVLVSVFSAIIYRQIPDSPAIIGMGLIIVGMVVLLVFSKTVSH